MKKHTNKLLIGALIGSVTLSFTSCSSDDNSVPKPDKEIEVPAEKATLGLSLESVKDSSALFKITAKNTAAVFYYLVPSQEEGKAPAVTTDNIFTKGIEVKDWKDAIEVKDLTPETEYYIFAAAKNSDGVISIVESPLTFKTSKKVDVFLEVTNVSATHDQILFSILPTGATEVRYKIVKKETKLTLDEVLETGSKLFNLKVTSNLKPKNFEADTEYTIYIAAVSATGMKILHTSEVKTKKADEAVDDGSVVFNSLSFTSELVEEAGKKVTYYQMTFANSDWQAQFEIGALTSNTTEIKEGKYVLPSKKDPGKPGPERIASNFVIKNLKTNKPVADIDYGEIVITKVNDKYEVKIDLVKLDYTQRFIGIFKGTPVHK
jgi:hypothetical protein